MLFACLLIGGPITGAHYNPAVTVGVYISNTHWREDFGMFCLTIVAQVFGGVAGVILAWLSLYNNSGSVDPASLSKGHVPLDEIGVLLPAQPGVALHNAFQIEMICTFIFVMINLLVKTGKTSPTNDGFLSCLAVAFTLLAMICVAASKTGACLNPAVGIAQTIFECI
jgi:aquaporin Z